MGGIFMLLGGCAAIVLLTLAFNWPNWETASIEIPYSLKPGSPTNTTLDFGVIAGVWKSERFLRYPPVTDSDTGGDIVYSVTLTYEYFPLDCAWKMQPLSQLLKGKAFAVCKRKPRTPQHNTRPYKQPRATITRQHLSHQTRRRSGCTLSSQPLESS